MKKWKKQSSVQKIKETKAVLPQEPAEPVFPDKALEAAEETIGATINDVAEPEAEKTKEVSLNEPNTDLEPAEESLQPDVEPDSPDTASSLLDNLDNLNKHL